MGGAAKAAGVPTSKDELRDTLINPYYGQIKKADETINGNKAGRAQAARILAETGGKPQMAAYESILGKDGKLGSAFRVTAQPALNPALVQLPDAIKAGLVKAGSVQAGNVQAGSVNAGKVQAGQLDMNALKADPRALDAMRSRALATGPSPWLQMQLERQGLEELSARDRAAQQALSGAAVARSQLAMRGGLGSGAAQRIAMNSARGMNAARQGIGRAGQLDRLNLAVADDQAKLGLLGQTAGLDLATADQNQGMAKFNIANTLDADKTNVANTLAADQFNVGTALDASKTNVANTLAADQFNVGNALAADKFNVGTAFDADKVNQAALLDARTQNANLLLDASKFNSSQAYDANKANKAATIGGLMGENAFNMDKFKTDMMGYAAGQQGAAIASGGGKK